MKCLVFIVVAIVLNAFPQHSGQSIGVSGAEAPKSTFRFANINDYDEMDDGSINETPEFVFHPDDFDYIPVLGLPKVPNRGPDYIGNAGDTGSGDTLVGENASEAAVTTEITAQRPSSCDYDAEEKLREVKISRRGRRRVSDIQCEQNMWNYKYKVLEYQRNVNHCMTWNRLYGNHSGIPGGIEATQGDFPHMGAVGWRLKDRADDGSIFVFLCGSSLISTRYSLTAAHCTSVRSYLKDDKNLEQSRPEIVRFGSVYIGSDNVKHHDTDGTKDVTIDDLIKLEEYRFRYKYNDIALIRLKEEVDISLNIRPACLYTEDIYTTGFGAVNVTGWGSTQTDSHSDILLFAELDLIDQNKCEEQLGNNIKDWRGLQNHQFCAGKAEGGVDTCDGDSGGPLQIQKPLPSALQDAGLTYYVLGITSFGVKCARPNKPAVYTKVSDRNFLCWIERTVWPEETNYDCTGELFKGYQLPPEI